MNGGVSAGELRARLWAGGPAAPGSVSGRQWERERERRLVRYRLFADRDPRVLEGLEPERDWSISELVVLLATQCGFAAHTRLGGEMRRDRYATDPDRTIAALDAFAERMRQAAERRSPVLFGTGRPGQLLSFYGPLASALSVAGCDVLTPGRGERVVIRTRWGSCSRRVRYVNGVALVHEPGARLLVDAPGAPGVRTRSPLPLRTVLAALSVAGRPLPELVVGDHGWVCGAGQLGIEAVGTADAEDPAPFVGQAEGKVAVVVPLNAGVGFNSYQPLARYVLNRVSLSQ